MNNQPKYSIDYKFINMHGGVSKVIRVKWSPIYNTYAYLGSDGGEYHEAYLDQIVDIMIPHKGWETLNKPKYSHISDSLMDHMQSDLYESPCIITSDLDKEQHHWNI